MVCSTIKTKSNIFKCWNKYSSNPKELMAFSPSLLFIQSPLDDLIIRI